MLLVESVDMEAALKKDLKKDVIVSMEWYVPTKPCKIPLSQKNRENGGTGVLPRVIKQDTFSEEPIVYRGRVPEDRPCFLIAYQNGNIQLMCNEINNTKNVSIIRLPSTVIIQAQWSPDGSIFAVAGLQTDLPESQRNVLHFISAYGMRLQIIRLAAGNFAGIAWESTGLRIGALIDTNIFLVVIKYPYKWAYCGQTLVYSYRCPDTLQEVLVFYETKMEVKTKRYLHNVCCIRAHGDYCVVVFRTDELRGAYTLQLCDSIGTPVDTQSTNVQPDYVAMNGSVVAVASQDTFTVWHYTLPRKSEASYKAPNKEQNNMIYYIDQNADATLDDDPSAARRVGRTLDNICAICLGPNFLLISRESGAMHRFGLPDLQQQQAVFRTGISPAVHMAVNCTGSRLALVGKHHTLKFFDLSKPNAITLVSGFEKKEVWAVEWDTEKDDSLAIMEKQRLMVIRGTETEEPVSHSGRICAFKDLVVQTVLLDEVFKDHDHVNKSYFINIEIKILKTIKDMLDAGKITEAIVLIEKNKHPKLWDLTIDMLKKMHDWFRIQQVLQTSSGQGDDLLVQQVWKHVGDYYFERQKWQNAAKYYEHSQDHEALAKCYLMMDDFARMETLTQQLPDGSPVLKQLAEIFTNYGLCEQASDKISEAFETCIKLNQWDRATELSHKYQLADVQKLLDQYANQMGVGNKTKNLAVAQLYRKAANYLQAARIVFEVADDEHAKQAPPLRLKKLYAATALEGLLNEDQTLNIEDTKLIDTAWRGAEAYHLYMLAHKQLYDGHFEASMKTCLTLVEYDDTVDPMDAYSLLVDEQQIYAKLALQIFLKHPPVDEHPEAKVECPNCDRSLQDYTLVCPNPTCDTRFPICVATGRPLYDVQFWVCPQCKHRAYEQEMQSAKFCPLCHFMVE
ncbi:WD repeat-containing protein 35 [Ditylenchus destructor]|nr:WD repeat-containing protein 35 [Ditylenchus destructor]